MNRIQRDSRWSIPVPNRLGRCAVALLCWTMAEGSVAKAADRDPKPQPAETPARRVLFVGNSLTYWNDGVYSHLEKLAASGGAAVRLETGKSVQGGATLKSNWERPEPRAMIAAGSWTDVLLQEDLPEINVSYFRENARKFVESVRAVKARPVLLMTWAYARLAWIDNGQIAEAHRAVASELGTEVAPVAVAWQRVLQERPKLELFAPDQEHPSLSGTYLETCVVYATLYRTSPEPLAYVPAGMDEADALYLRRMAWEVVREWKP